MEVWVWNLNPKPSCLVNTGMESAFSPCCLVSSHGMESKLFFIIKFMNVTNTGDLRKPIENKEPMRKATNTQKEGRSSNERPARERPAETNGDRKKRSRRRRSKEEKRKTYRRSERREAVQEIERTEKRSRRKRTERRRPNGQRKD